MEKKKISIFALHLGFGGIEKATSTLANILCEEHDVEIVSIYKVYEKPAFYINDKVKIKYLTELIPNKKEFLEALEKMHLIKAFKEGMTATKVLITKHSKLIKAIKECDSDIIISTRCTFNKIIGKYKKDKILIAWEHMHHNNKQWYINKLKNSLENFNYLVPVSKALAEYYSNIVDVKCVNIPLCIDKIPEENSSLDRYQITYVGRLAQEKGLLDLLQICEIANRINQHIILNVVGDGIQRTSIEQHIRQFKLEEIVKMHGYLNKEETEKVLLNTGIFAITSFYESFGLVLIEAMSYGIPCVAFDSAEGAKEIIDDGVNGYLIPNRDKSEMLAKIIELHENYDLRSKMGEAAKEKAKQFSYENTKKKWLEFIEKLGG